ncbi:MAG: membrane protein [Chloroflexota bacterium]|nr:slipin family protein [Chloroflexota bacterium]NOG63561.1 slipin family protein [Chloroflexota bacterium]GIK62728.1 MAG: membrane protein [Chloroflexota bacterium]
MEILAVCCGSALVAGLLYLISGFRIVNEYERGVVFRLGRVTKGARGPGWFFILPGLERMLVVDLRVITLDVPAQECISRDNVTIRVNAVVYYRVLDPIKAVVTIKNFNVATLQIAQTTLRSIIGQHELDQLLSQRERINEELQKVIDEQTEPWGIKVSVVEIKDVELPQSMQRVMARQAEADRERRAKIIHAEGELQAAIQLRQAAEQMANEPIALQLRYLQTLTEIAVEKNSTILFPIPIDILEAFMERGGSKGRTTPPPD